MSHELIAAEDPRITAYVLGELTPTEQVEFETALSQSPDAQQAVAEIRELVGRLTSEFQQEPIPSLSTAQRSAILSVALSNPPPAIDQSGSGKSPSTPHSSPRHWFAPLAAMAGMIVVTILFTNSQRESSIPQIAEHNVGQAELWRASQPGMPRGSILESRSDTGVRWNDGVAQKQSRSAARLSDGVADSEADNDEIESSVTGPLDALLHSEVDAGASSRDAAQLPEATGGQDKTMDLKLQFAVPNNGTGSKSGGSGGGGDTVLGGSVANENKEEAPMRRKAAPHSGNGPAPAQGVPQRHVHDAIKRSPASAGMPAGVSQESKSRPEVAMKKNGRAALVTDATAPNREVSQDGKTSARRTITAGEVMYSEKGFKKYGGMQRGDATPGSKSDARFKDSYEIVPELAKQKNGEVESEVSRQELPQVRTNSELNDRINVFNKHMAGNDTSSAEHTTDIKYSSRELLLRLTKQKNNSLSAAVSDFSYQNEQYTPIVENQFFSAYQNPLSTFSADVDTAAFTNVRRFFDNNQLPPPDAVRIEELINYFSYSYPQPEGEHPIALAIDAANCPWHPAHQLVRIGLKAKEISRDHRPPYNLVFLVDVSGSMQAENKLSLVKFGLNQLTDQLTETDKVGIVTYADTAAVRLESTNGTDKAAIHQVVDSLVANGSTNGADGIQRAYDLAVNNRIPQGANRVILCTDGDFNVGVTGDALFDLIEKKRNTNVFFSALGFGMGNLKDGMLEKLADKGNGHYAYIDGQKEARRVFVDDLMGTLVTVAKDVKLQVEFNPLQVASYRLLGYENRVLATADFQNDKKDAGEMGAGHTVTALYEIIPATAAPQPDVGDDLRYRRRVLREDDPMGRELLNVKVRYKLPEEETSRLIERSVAHPAQVVNVTNGAGDLVSYSLKLQKIPAEEAAKSINGLYKEGTTDAPKVVAQSQTQILAVIGKAEQVAEIATLLSQMGEKVDPASKDLNWAAAVAAYGLILRRSHYRGDANLDMVLELATAAKGDDPTGRRQEFIDLVRKTKALVGDQTRAGVIDQINRLSVEQRQDLASIEGKYKNLVRVISAPQDVQTYGPMHDFGLWEGTSYRGENNLPKSYWVYVSPNWYLWEDQADVK